MNNFELLLNLISSPVALFPPFSTGISKMEAGTFRNCSNYSNCLLQQCKYNSWLEQDGHNRAVQFTQSSPMVQSLLIRGSIDLNYRRKFAISNTGQMVEKFNLIKLHVLRQNKGGTDNVSKSDSGLLDICIPHGRCRIFRKYRYNRPILRIILMAYLLINMIFIIILQRL